jgi:hypothetical protein
MTTVAMYEGRYEEVWKLHEMVLHSINEPWPPPQDQDPMPDLKQSTALLELFGDGGNWEAPKRYPDPKIFSVHPGLLETLATLAIAIHAHAKVESRQNKTEKAKQLRKKADSYLDELMKHMNDSLGREPWDGISKTDGIKGSAMRRAMDEERTPLVELLAYLGDNGMREGLHYTTAIAAATPYPKITALLEEHQSLCATLAGDDVAPIFQRSEKLVDFLTGSWKGAYLYRSSGPRIDPKGHFALYLTATAGHHDNHVELSGHGIEELGDITVKGRAYKSGEVRLRVCQAGNDENEGWEYVGSVDLERAGFGGFWGLPDIPRSKSVGTFFFFKSDEGVVPGNH